MLKKLSKLVKSLFGFGITVLVLVLIALFYIFLWSPVWDNITGNITSGKMMWTLVISYAYTFNWFRSKNPELYYKEVLRVHGLIRKILTLIFVETISIVASFFINIIPWAILLFIFTLVGSMIGRFN